MQMHRPEPRSLLLAVCHDHERAGKRQKGRLDERRRRRVAGARRLVEQQDIGPERERCLLYTSPSPRD